MDFSEISDCMGHSLYGGWNLHRQVPAADSGVSESVRVCTGVDSHGDPHLGDDLSHDDEGRLPQHQKCGQEPQGLFVTWIVNWLIKPFTMYGMASLFFFVVFKAFITPELATEYLAGAVLLGAVPCTAMVFVWSALTKGDPAYTVVQVATNDLIILVAFVPIVKFLLGVSNVFVPWDTLILSVVLFVVIPLAGGMLTRYFVTQKNGAEYFENAFVKKFDDITTIGLLLTLVLIFAFQGQVILENPLHIVLIAIPLVLQTFLIFSIAYGVCWLLKLPHRIAAPAGMIGASNFFELAVAVSVALFGTTSPAALATTVGVLTEVPVMLFLVKIANKTKGRFPACPNQKLHLSVSITPAAARLRRHWAKRWRPTCLKAILPERKPSRKSIRMPCG